MRSLGLGAVPVLWLVGASGARAADVPSTDTSVTTMVIDALAAISIFFFGVYEMTSGMRAVAGDRLRDVLERATRNRFASVGTGAVTTALVGSSSIVTILTVGLVSAGLVSFANVIGVVMGANIGTTLTSQVFASGLSDYFGVLLATGAATRFLLKGPKAKAWGTAIMGIGFVFLGLEMLQSTLAPLKEAAWFRETVRQLEQVWLGIGIGAIITVLIQSSSATMGVVIVMAAEGAISLPAGVAIMMGAELGTCADTLASTIGQTRAAVRTGVFHLIFNVVNVLVLAWFASPLADVAQSITPGRSHGAIAQQIANAHVIFNCLGVLMVLPFTRHAARAMHWLVPEPRGGAEGRPTSGVEAGAR